MYVRIAALLFTALLLACKGEPPSTQTESAAPAPPPASATTAAEPAAAATPAPEDPTGAYMSMTPLPAEFAEIDHLSLATIDENGAPAPLNGFIRPKEQAAQDYKLVDPRLDGNRLTFTTAAVDGVQYAFDGAFAVAGNFPANPPAYETAVLTGTLKKLRGGAEIASTPVRFRYEMGG